MSSDAKKPEVAGVGWFISSVGLVVVIVSFGLNNLPEIAADSDPSVVFARILFIGSIPATLAALCTVTNHYAQSPGLDFMSKMLTAGTAVFVAIATALAIHYGVK
ncbi:hypothetical protein ABZ546_12560 [Brachybacterium paraconglomeratum]